MSAPQGYITFTGIENVLSGVFTLTDDVQPSIAKIYIAPPSVSPPPVGELGIFYGGGGVLFPDCRISDIHQNVSDDGEEIWCLTVQDMRWRWQFARISGEYNLRDDAQNLRENRAGDVTKNDRQLAALLFDALGVKRYDLGALPGNTFPEVRWDEDRADSALSELCESLGCRVVPRPRGQFIICQAGVGARIPKSGELLKFNDSIIPPVLASTLRFVGGPNLYQKVLELELVGEDVDGSIKRINELSYAPSTGWQNMDIPSFMNLDSNKLSNNADTSRRKLAQKSVFRWFRPKLPFSIANQYTINDLFEIELSDRQILEQVVEGKIETRPAWVFGHFYQDSHSQKEAEELTLLDPLKFPRLLWHHGFSIDKERCVIMLNDFCTRRQFGRLAPPKMWLYTSLQIRDRKTHGWARAHFDYPVAPRSGGPTIKIVRDDVQYCIVEDLSSFQIFDNSTKPIQTFGVPTGGNPFQTRSGFSFQQGAKYYLEAAAKELTVQDATSASFGGFFNVILDGALRQVVWDVDFEGFARTHVSRNTDALGDTPTRAERVFNAKIADVMDKQANKPKGRKQRGVAK